MAKKAGRISGMAGEKHIDGRSYLIRPARK
jgi:hypothetical protein